MTFMHHWHCRVDTHTGQTSLKGFSEIETCFESSYEADYRYVHEKPIQHTSSETIIRKNAQIPRNGSNEQQLKWK
jgi:hypothetical protein